MERKDFLAPRIVSRSMQIGNFQVSNWTIKVVPGETKGPLQFFDVWRQNGWLKIRKGYPFSAPRPALAVPGAPVRSNFWVFRAL